VGDVVALHQFLTFLEPSAMSDTHDEHVHHDGILAAKVHQQLEDQQLEDQLNGTLNLEKDGGPAVYKNDPSALAHPLFGTTIYIGRNMIDTIYGPFEVLTFQDLIHKVCVVACLFSRNIGAGLHFGLGQGRPEEERRRVHASALVLCHFRDAGLTRLRLHPAAQRRPGADLAKAMRRPLLPHSGGAWVRLRGQVSRSHACPGNELPKISK